MHRMQLLTRWVDEVEIQPTHLVCSDLRQVPDTQEVFLSKDTDISYIIEVLERVEAGSGVEAVK